MSCRYCKYHRMYFDMIRGVVYYKDCECENIQAQLDELHPENCQYELNLNTCPYKVLSRKISLKHYDVFFRMRSQINQIVEEVMDKRYRPKKPSKNKYKWY